MLKKLRNKFLIMNMISTFFLILISFIVIFSITYSSTEKEIEKSLFRAFSTQWQPRNFEVFGKHTPHQNDNRHEGKSVPTDNRRFNDARVFSVLIKEDGSFTTRSMFGDNNEQYRDVAQIAVKQTEKKGEFKYGGALWRYGMIARDKDKIMAVVDISAERAIIRKLVLSFTGCAAVLLMLIFFVSLFYANRAIRPVRDAWDKQKQFIADASHELKTPLSTINANIDVVLSHPEGKISEEEKWLTYIKKESARLTELTDDLLFMAKLEGDARRDTEKVNLSEIVESNILNLEAVAFENGKILEYNIENEIYAEVIPGQITRLILILLDNAIKYSPKGDVIKIGFSLPSKDWAVLTVKNRGESIPLDEQKKIFDRFYRADKSRTGKNGYGLGLSIAYEITKIHKGKINVTSDEKNGTEFTVLIPIKR